MPSSALTSSADIATLYADHHSWLRNWIASKLQHSGREVAEDLAHDTFVSLISSRNRAPQPDELLKPRAYLATVAKGVVVSWIRRQSLERAWLETLATLPEPQHPSVEHQHIIVETLAEIDAMLDTLKPRAKQAFLMATVDGMKQADIAAALGISIPTVKSYMHKAYLLCLSQMSDD